jgi:hypothetical protein
LFAESGWRVYPLRKCHDGKVWKLSVRVFGILDARRKKLFVFLDMDKTVGDFILDRESIRHQFYWLNLQSLSFTEP